MKMKARILFIGAIACSLAINLLTGCSRNDKGDMKSALAGGERARIEMGMATWRPSQTNVAACQPGWYSLIFHRRMIPDSLQKRLHRPPLEK